jgi:putative nucleotidyltransferase with HDIG domain
MDSESVVAAEWLLIWFHSPDGNRTPIGVAIVDHTADRLYVKIVSPVQGLDPDASEIAEGLAMDLLQRAQECGAERLLASCEQSWSHTFRLGRRHAFRTRDPIESLATLLRREVLDRSNIDAAASYSPDQLARAQTKIPFSAGVALRALVALKDQIDDISVVESIVAEDPVISAHLVKVANSALFSRGLDVRSVRQAISRLGFDTVTWQVSALSLRKAYSPPFARNIWNHCLSVAQIVRLLSRRTSFPEREAALTALVHDVGRLAMLTLPDFMKKLSDLMARGDFLAEAEQILCNLTHSELGADILETWNFPADMVKAVREHHSISEKSTRLSKLLFLAEYLSGSEESLTRHHVAKAIAESFGLAIEDLEGEEMKFESDLEAMRFTAGI